MSQAVLQELSWYPDCIAMMQQGPGYPALAGDEMPILTQLMNLNLEALEKCLAMESEMKEVRLQMCKLQAYVSSRIPEADDESKSVLPEKNNRSNPEDNANKTEDCEGDDGKIFEGSRVTHEEEEMNLATNTFHFVEVTIQPEADVFTGIIVQCAAKKKSITTLFSALILMCLAWYAQLFLAYSMIPNISRDDFDAQIEAPRGDAVINLFEEWRWSYAEGSLMWMNFTWAHWVCSGNDWTWQAAIVADYQHYVQTVSVLPRIEMASGKLFGIFALSVWAARVVSQLRSLGSFLALALMADAGTDSKFRWSFSSNPWVKLMLFPVVGVRLIVIVKLAVEGVQYLSRINVLPDFIFNCLALEFIFAIPDLVFKAFSARYEARMVEFAVEEGMKVRVPEVLLTSASVLSVVLGAGIVIYGYYTFLQPFADKLQNDVLNHLCAETCYLDSVC